MDEHDGIFRGRIKSEVVPAILSTIKDLEEYHPLTVRQVFYQLVSREVIQNSFAEYGCVSRTLTKLRENYLVPWSVIADRTRRLIEKRGISDLEEHLRTTMSYMFDRYSRCLVQNQENYVEIWTEKDALSTIIEEAVWMYCCRVVVCRGQISATFLNQYAERIGAAHGRGQRPVLLYLGDLDPTGMRIPQAIFKKLHQRYGLHADVRRIALWPKHVHEYDLPFNPAATKKTDPNYAWYAKKGFADYSVELDAMHPRDLTELIRYALQDALDIEDMQQQQHIESRERRTLLDLKASFREICRQKNLRV